MVMTHDYPPFRGGGLALNVRELAEALAQAQAYDVTVLSARLRDHFADDRAGPADTAGTSVRYGRAGLVCAARALASADLVVTHWTFSFRRLSSLSVLLGPLLGRPTVCVVHTRPDHLLYNRLRWLPHRLRRLLLSAAAVAMRRCAAVVALGTAHSDELRRAGLPVTHVLPLPVSTAPIGRTATPDSRAEGTDARVSTVGIVGELSFAKGSDRMPALVSWLTPRFEVRIAGAGPLAGWLAEQIDMLPPAKRARVMLAGHLDPAQMAGFYRSVDVLLVPSRTEAQPRVILEAMLLGVVVAAPADTAGFGLVADGRTGVLVDADNGRGVLDAILTLSGDPGRVAWIRQEAAAFARVQQQGSRLGWLSLLSTARCPR